jgi:glycine C-acetyltransferase
MDIFDKIVSRPGPLGMYSEYAHGYFMFPELEGEISNRMVFRGRKKSSGV